ncbi:epidermis-specific secreted glycoprotein EP1-like [Pyrus ussuriensis x Pyrus communis]|uniref:Epidermis-specific secreted glycoprotein EP1-like n=1 Tax=Pyrus ussuriensis x Pyrus communis TaxID=2448454 RepID=A0A5N5GKA0_9ROSA|nr:epidermis-specific secreted glycoprotein EP1-like [Pyrus ussuriensis x Pyrus communis]
MFLRLGIDGNVELYTYNDKVDFSTWRVTVALFDTENYGTFGLCEDSQCVACPSSRGLLGWSKSCAPEKLTSCDAKSFRYYKVERVDHFLSKYTNGVAVKENDCAKKCTSDCKCLASFSSRIHQAIISR